MLCITYGSLGSHIIMLRPHKDNMRDLLLVWSWSQRYVDDATNIGTTCRICCYFGLGVYDMWMMPPTLGERSAANRNINVR